MKINVVLRVAVLSMITITMIIGLSSGNVAAEPAAKETADIILYNGKIVTVDKDFNITKALAIGGDTLLAVGSDDEILHGFAGQGTKMINLNGKTVVPGFIDAHTHINTLGWGRINFRGCKTIADVVSVVENEVAKKNPGEWVISGEAGGAGSPMTFPGTLQEKRNPTRWDLDPVSPNNPVELAAGHICIFNSYALALAGITKNTPDPAGGAIGRDPVTGEPTGIMTEAAINLVTKFIPPATYEDTLAAVEGSRDYYRSKGITSCKSEGMSSDGIRALLELKSKNLMPLRVSASISPPNMNLTLAEIETYLKSVAGTMASYGGTGDIQFRIEGGGEFGIDGGTNSGSALQRFQYVGGTGVLWYGVQKVSQEKFTQVSLLCAKYNFRMNVHASGGAAIDLTLNAWEEVNKQIPITDRRWSIHHVQAPSKKNFEQIKNLGVVVEIDWVKESSSVFQYYPEEFCENEVNPLRDWLDNGIRIATGSDSDVGDPNPIGWIYTAATKIMWTDGTLIGFNERITPKEALIISTINGAYITFEEDIKGSIEKGKLADLVVLSNDILSVPVNQIKDIEVLMTMQGGGIVYKKEGTDIQVLDWEDWMIRHQRYSPLMDLRKKILHLE